MRHLLLSVTILRLPGAVIAAIVLTASPAFAQPTGGIGCITDVNGQRLPRASVAISAQGNKATALADGEGCYEFTTLPQNLYRVTARFAGFENVTRGKIRIVAGQIARLDFTLPVGSICECLGPPATVRERWEFADAVVHVRIIDEDGERPAPRGFFKHRANVLEPLKGGTIMGAVVTFLQDQSSGAPDPYGIGEELVLFLRWLPNEQTFVPAWSMGAVGKPVHHWLADLRKLSNEK